MSLTVRPEEPPLSAIAALREALQRRGACNLLAAEHAGLVAVDDLARDQDAHVRDLAARGVRVEERDMPFYGLPYVLTSERFAAISERFARLFTLLERVIDLYVDDPGARAFFGLAPRHDDLVRIPVRYRPRIQYCRFDFTLDARGVPRIYELNTHCPAMMVFGYHLGRTFERGACHRALLAAGLRPHGLGLDRAGAFARAVLAAAEEAGALGRGRHVAVLNSRYLTMNTELDALTQQFRDEGCDARRCHVEDLSFDGGRLLHEGWPIDVVFNKYDDSRGADAYPCAFSRTTAEVQAYLDAYAAGAVFAVNTFPAMYLTEQKSTLAFLCSDWLRARLTADEAALIDEIVPRTRLVAHLDPAALAEARAERERFVLKRALDTRGRSVLIGATLSAAEWEAALEDACAQPQDDGYVLQNAAPPESQVPAPPELLGTDRVYTSLACFLLRGAPSGLLVRSSVEPTTNVGRRGFLQPALVVDVA